MGDGPRGTGPVAGPRVIPPTNDGTDIRSAPHVSAAPGEPARAPSGAELRTLEERRTATTPSPRYVSLPRALRTFVDDQARGSITFQSGSSQEITVQTEKGIYRLKILYREDVDTGYVLLTKPDKSTEKFERPLKQLARLESRAYVRSATYLQDKARVAARAEKAAPAPKGVEAAPRPVTPELSRKTPHGHLATLSAILGGAKITGATLVKQGWNPTYEVTTSAGTYRVEFKHAEPGSADRVGTVTLSKGEEVITRPLDHSVYVDASLLWLSQGKLGPKRAIAKTSDQALHVKLPKVVQGMIGHRKVASVIPLRAGNGVTLVTTDGRSFKITYGPRKSKRGAYELRVTRENGRGYAVPASSRQIRQISQRLYAATKPGAPKPRVATRPVDRAIADLETALEPIRQHLAPARARLDGLMTALSANPEGPETRVGSYFDPFGESFGAPPVSLRSEASLGYDPNFRSIPGLGKIPPTQTKIAFTERPVGMVEIPTPPKVAAIPRRHEPARIQLDPITGEYRLVPSEEGRPHRRKTAPEAVALATPKKD